VANFLGHSNLFQGKVIELVDPTARVELVEGRTCRIRPNRQLTVTHDVQFMVRPERIKTQAEEPSQENRFYCRIVTSNYFGDSARYLVELEGGKTLKVRNQTPYTKQLKDGDHVWIWWDPEDCVVL
jgi:ABC-type Fe3+/spermidine/putrescine transport system ATPase subunit